MPDRATPQVLYVEDDRIHLVLMEEVFRLLPGWELICAETGAEALALLADARPALALIDMNLPDTNGLALLARLKQMPQLDGMRCVALSADDPCDVVRAARAAGFDDYWLKPIDVPRLTAALQGLLQ
jgi:CheY-like chemotaxis protein